MIKGLHIISKDISLKENILVRLEVKLTTISQSSTLAATPKVWIRIPIKSI